MQNLSNKPKCYQNLRDIVKNFKKTLLNHLPTIQSPEPLYPNHDDMQSFLHQRNTEKFWNSALLTLTESISASCSTNLFMYTVTFPPITYLLHHLYRHRLNPQSLYLLWLTYEVSASLFRHGGNFTFIYLLDTRSPFLEACNYSTFLSRYFHRLIYF